MVLLGQRTQERSIFKLEQIVVSNLVQELLPFSKIETTSFEPTVAQELLAVSNLAQELLVVSKIETTTFEPTVSQELIVVSKSSGTASSFEN
jgi:ribosomal protein L17